MKYFLLITISFAFCLNTAAQNKIAEFENVCGDGKSESTSFIESSGKVIKIIDGNSFIVRESNGKKRTVKLSAVNSSSNEKAAKDFLIEELLNKEVSIEIKSKNLDDKEVYALVLLGETDVNRTMIEKGISVFQKADTYDFSNYLNCIYQNLEEKAKKNKLGIWAK